jgi:hypothetical protein
MLFLYMDVFTHSLRIRKSLKFNLIVETLKDRFTMLLSSSRTKKKKEGNSDVASRKSPRVSRNQTACLIETPMQENSDSDDSDTTH